MIWILKLKVGIFVSPEGKIILLSELSSNVPVKLNRSLTFFAVNAKAK